MNRLARICLVGTLILSPCVATSTPIVVFGQGVAVSSADHFANFDSLTTFGIDLANYSEGGLNVRAVSPSGYGLSFPCDGCIFGSPSPAWYVNGGGMYDGYASIGIASGSAMSAVELAVGTGFQQLSFNVYWETYAGATLSGSGTLWDVFSGTTLGFADLEGFDELRLGAYVVDPGSSFVSSTPNRPNAIVIDRLRVQANGVSVPEPSTFLLLLAALPMLAIARRTHLSVR